MCPCARPCAAPPSTCLLSAAAPACSVNPEHNTPTSTPARTRTREHGQDPQQGPRDVREGAGELPQGSPALPRDPRVRREKIYYESALSPSVLPHTIPPSTLPSLSLPLLSLPRCVSPQKRIVSPARTWIFPPSRALDRRSNSTDRHGQAEVATARQRGFARERLRLCSTDFSPVSSNSTKVLRIKRLFADCFRTFFVFLISFYSHPARTRRESYAYVRVNTCTQ